MYLESDALSPEEDEVSRKTIDRQAQFVPQWITVIKPDLLNSYAVMYPRDREGRCNLLAPQWCNLLIPQWYDAIEREGRDWTSLPSIIHNIFSWYDAIEWEMLHRSAPSFYPTIDKWRKEAKTSNNWEIRTNKTQWNYELQFVFKEYGNCYLITANLEGLNERDEIDERDEGTQLLARVGKFRDHFFVSESPKRRRSFVFEVKNIKKALIVFPI